MKTIENGVAAVLVGSKAPVERVGSVEQLAGVRQKVDTRTGAALPSAVVASRESLLVDIDFSQPIRRFPSMPIARLDQIPSLSLEVHTTDRVELMNVIQSALRVAVDLALKNFTASVGMKDFSGRSLAAAGMAAAQSVNALLSAVSAKCTLDVPPEEIELRTKGSKLVYRCYHNPAHEFDLSGNQIL